MKQRKEFKMKSSQPQDTTESRDYVKEEFPLSYGTTVPVVRFDDLDLAYDYASQCDKPISVIECDDDISYPIWVCDPLAAASLVKDGFRFCTCDNTFAIKRLDKRFRSNKWIKRVPDLIHKEFVLVNDRLIRVFKYDNPHSCLEYIRKKNIPASIVLGNPDDPYGAFWICNPEDGYKLVEIGFEYFDVEKFKDDEKNYHYNYRHYSEDDKGDGDDDES